MAENNSQPVIKITRIRVEGRLIGLGDWVIVNSLYHRIRVFGLIVELFVEGGHCRTLVKVRAYTGNRRYQYCIVDSEHLYNTPTEWGDMTDFSDWTSESDSE